MNGVVMEFEASTDPLFELQRKALDAAQSHSDGPLA